MNVKTLRKTFSRENCKIVRDKVTNEATEKKFIEKNICRKKNMRSITYLVFRKKSEGDGERKRIHDTCLLVKTKAAKKKKSPSAES
jgi:hypothetical protein